MKFILQVLLMGLTFFIAAKIVPGVSIDGFWNAVLAAVLIALANATIGLILRIMTLPLNFLTLGLVSFIISVLMILLVDNLMDSFSTTGFLSAAFLAIVLAIVNALFGAIAGDKD